MEILHYMLFFTHSFQINWKNTPPKTRLMAAMRFFRQLPEIRLFCCCFKKKKKKKKEKKRRKKAWKSHCYGMLIKGFFFFKCLTFVPLHSHECQWINLECILSHVWHCNNNKIHYVKGTQQNYALCKLYASCMSLSSEFRITALASPDSTLQQPWRKKKCIYNIYSLTCKDG